MIIEGSRFDSAPPWFREATERQILDPSPLMKIAFIFPPIWPSDTDGSLQIWNREVTKRLARTCEIVVYSGKFSQIPQDQIDGVADRRLSTRWDSRFLKYSQLFYNAIGIDLPPFASDLWYPWYAFRIALEIRKRACDVVHVYNYPQFCPIIKFLNPNARIVLNMHGELLTQISFKNLQNRLSQIDAIICCSEFVSKPIRSNFPAIAHRCKTVPMGISPVAFATARHALKNTAARRLLYVGRVSPEKGIHVLLDAFEIIVRRYPDATLTIVGPEWIPPRGYLADLCLERKVVDGFAHFYEGNYIQKLRDNLSQEAAKRVTFAGFVPHRDVPSFYVDADIYVSPSFYESFGMSLIEAMAAGLPVVAARGGAVADLISDCKNGLLVEPANPAAIANAVETLLGKPELRNSIACRGRKMVCRQFSYESITSELLQLYQNIVARHEESREQSTNLPTLSPDVQTSKSKSD